MRRSIHSFLCYTSFLKIIPYFHIKVRYTGNPGLPWRLDICSNGVMSLCIIGPPLSPRVQHWFPEGEKQIHRFHRFPFLPRWSVRVNSIKQGLRRCLFTRKLTPTQDNLFNKGLPVFVRGNGVFNVYLEARCNHWPWGERPSNLLLVLLALLILEFR